jgi:hypothetical protein
LIREKGITDLVFSDLDKCFSITTTAGQVKRWTLPNFELIKVETEEEPEKKAKDDNFKQFRSLDFVLEERPDVNQNNSS